MSTLEKVREEIKRRINSIESSNLERYEAYAGELYALKNLLSFIDSIQEKSNNDIETAMQFIEDCTCTCSNETFNGLYKSWLTPEQAIRAVEIATGK